MKDHKNIRGLFKKYSLGQCSPEEIAEIVAYLKTHKHSEGIPSVEEVLALLRESPRMEESAADHVYNRIRKNAEVIERRKAGKQVRRKYYMAAAMAVVLISAGSLFFGSSLLKKDGVIEVREEITLELDNGQIKVIKSEGSGEVHNASGDVVGKQDKNRISYVANGKSKKHISYNTLKVPYGKRFDVELSDGTVVYLNSGSSLKYPENFPGEGRREVELTGEAFFEVAEDKEHPFVVNTKELNVKVFGTRFNISAYPEDDLTDVVLVEGSVGMYEDIRHTEKGIMLTPGHKGSFYRNDKNIEISAVETSVYTSWIGGELVFRNMTFENILKKLERQYNVNITMKNRTLAGEEFNASFDREPVEDVLEYFKMTYGIRYTVEGDNITIN